MEKTIRKLVTDDGKVIHDQTKILEEVKTFYQNLFKRRECSEPESYLKDLESLSSLHKLSVADAESLEGLLTVNEISNSLKQMKNNKCPGIDGFPSEFFKVFWGKLKYFVLRALNESYISGQLSISLRQCIISCLPKGDKPRHLLKNWRPVSLLSVIYKIASSALSARLKSVLEKIISPTQSGFVANRFIGENIRLIYDIMHYTKKENIPGLLMLIDFQKAFDSVSWKFLDSILNFFGFKNSFQRWIKIMNTNIQASVMQCGVLSGLFDIERGCRQGDPLSPYLFLLCAQVLYLMIVNNKDIKGIFIDGREYKLTQFADDTTLILNGTKKSLNAALNTLVMFGSFSGLTINADKTKIIWIGKKSYSSEKLDTDQTLKWGATSFDLLGINFSVNLEEMTKLNYTPVIASIKKMICTWTQRHLTPIGKITIIKTLALSKLSHLFLCLPSPEVDVVKTLENAFFKFIWDNKPDKIKRSTLKKNYLNGGLNMIDLNNFIAGLKCTWIRRMYVNHDANWVYSAKPYIQSPTNLIMLGSEYAKSVARKCTNKFWSQVLNAWGKLQSRIQMNSNNNALYSPLWYNPEISKAYLYLPHWYKKGIICLGDMISNEGVFVTQNLLQSIFGIKTNFLEYHRVITCIKGTLAKLRLKCTVSVKPIYPNNIRLLQKSKKGSRDFYKVLTDFDNQDNKPIYSFWEECFRTTMSSSDWHKIFNICFKTVKDNFLVWTQYRILYRILGTKDYLATVKITTDRTCGICGNHVETIKHLLVDCEKVKTFWGEIQTFIKVNAEADFRVNEKDIIFGSIENSSNIALNTIYFAAKTYIFQNSKHNSQLFLHNFINYLKKIYLEHEYVARLDEKHDVFLKQWQSLSKIFVGM